jgi:hypothetical protein
MVTLKTYTSVHKNSQEFLKISGVNKKKGQNLCKYAASSAINHLP